MMCVYKVIHYFVEGGQNYHFYLRFGAQLQGLKITLERWQHHGFIFTLRLIDLLVKLVDFIHLCCIMHYANSES